MKPRPTPNSGTLRDCAEAQLKAKPGPRQPQDEADLRRLQHELEVHQIELELQNEELRTAQEETATALERYSDHFDFAPVGFFNLTADGTIRVINLKGASLLGLERAQLPGRRFGLFVAEADRGDFANFLKRVFATGAVQTCELALVRQFQPPLAGRLEATRSPDGKECRAVLIDITAHKRAEETLREANARYCALFEGSADGIIIADLETKSFKYVNPAVCRMLGYTEDELRIMGVSDIHPQAELPSIIAGFDAQGRGEKTLAADVPCLRKDGSIVYTDISATRVMIDGRPCNVGIFRDITERKRAEALVRERGQLVALVAEVGSALMAGGPLPDLLQRCSEAVVRHLDGAFARIWTLNEKENMLELQASAGLYTHLNGPHGRVPVGKFKIGLIAEERKPHLTNQVVGDPRVGDQDWAKREGMVAFAGYPLMVDNRVMGVIAMFARHPLSDVVVQGLAAIANNIAAIILRKQAETELAYERDLLRALLDNSPDQIYFKDVQSRFLKASQTLAKNFGAQDTSELTGKTDFDFFAEAHARLAFEDEQEIIRTGQPIVGKAEKEVWPDGRESWALTTKMPFRNQAGEIIGTFGVSKDITAMKEAEAKLVREQARLQFIFESMPVGVAVARRYADGRFERLINDAHLRISGLTREQDQIPGIYATITHPDDAVRQAELGRQFSDGRTGQFSIEKRYLRPDGSVVWVIFSFQRHNYPDGSMEELTTVVDITERKRVEQALQASEERMRLQTTALESTASGVAITDRRGTIQWVNAAFTQLTGYPAAEAVGQNPRVLKSGQHPDSFYQTMWETISAGHAWKGELINRRKDGQLYHEEMTITPVHDTAGAITHFVAIKQDISERKRAEVELENLHKQLVDASRRGGMAEIATNVLHNVGNVLNSVNISTGLLVDHVKHSKVSSLARVVTLLQEHAPALGEFIGTDPKGKQVPEFLARLSEQLLAEQEFMAGELDSLSRNVEHIKGIVAMQQGYAAFGGVKEIINLVQLVEDSLHMSENAMIRHGVTVSREFEDVPPVNLEKHKILQILVNLLRNAKHACQDSDRADKQMTVRVARGAGRIKISVTDNGIGIAPENLMRIFNHGFTTRQGGHGFGLHSSANNAKEMGGALTVHSAGPGQGATFTLELPVATPDPAP